VRISERGDVLTISERPGLTWFLGFWFVAGGVLAMSMVFLATNAPELEWWERVLGFGIGAAVFAGGVFTLANSPAIVTVLNRKTGLATMRIRGLRKDERIVFRCGDIIVVEMREEKDSDGDPCYQLLLGLRTGRTLALHSIHGYGRESCEAERQRIRRFLGLDQAA